MKIGINLSKEKLHLNIEKRVDEMISNGLIDEVKSFYSYRNLNALQSVAYNEIFDYLDGLYSIDDAVGKIKINTKQYAKRQLTWFKKDKNIKWI